MAELGYKPGPADGLWGPRSAKAYAAFLRDAGMPPGEMLTLDALRAMRTRAGEEEAPGAVAKAGNETPSTTAESEAKAAGPARPAPKCTAWNTKKFFEAATPEIVTRCLRGGSDPKARDKDGRTPLHMAAAWSGSSAVIDVLVKAGADPNAREEEGKETPLHWAARAKGSSAVIAVLLKGGANLSARRREAGATPLLLSVWNEDIAVMKALLEAGADPNVGTVGLGEGGGDTPLHYAVSLEKPVFITTLLEAGADPNARNKLGETPLDQALNNNNLAVADLLLKGGETEKAKRTDPNARDRDGRTSLHRAAENSAAAAIKTLLKAGVAPNARDENGETPLHKAASKSKRPTVIAALVKGGADLNARDKSGGTPLHRAASSNGTPEVSAALLEAGANPNTRDKGRETPLHAAVFNKNPAVAAVLLKSGADPNIQNTYGQTPLQIAAGRNASLAVTAALLKGGADPNVPDEYDDTPLHVAAAHSEDRAIIAALLRAGADPNARSDDRDTPLHRAVAGNNPAAITALLKAGADPSIPDFSGNTPMDDARNKNDPAVIAALQQGQRRQAGSARPARPASGSPSGECASGPICRQTVKNAEVVLERARELLASGNHDITNTSLAGAFTTRSTIACMKACLEREETRTHCRDAIQQAIGELEKTYESTVRSAREASLDDDYVDEFEASPQNSSFGREYFSYIQGNLDTCGY